MARILRGCPNAEFFAPAIESVDDLIVPTLSILEVFKKVLQERGEDDALQIAAVMQQGHVADLNVLTAVSAAKLGSGPPPCR